MAIKILLPLLLLLPAFVSAKDYYTAAVFEHRPRAVNEEGRNQVKENLKYYEKAASVAAEKGADILVFNEYGLFGYEDRNVFRKVMETVPDPQKVKFNPCVNSANDLFILPTLSCMAKNNKMYVVANMGDIHTCEGYCDAENTNSCNENCPKDGAFMYNTNVAFDREGNLIARYHKMHPYFENLNVPEEPEFVKFKTDFGTFGLIICFDSVFVESMILATYHQDLDNIIFPTFWFDDILPLNGIEWQQSWAIANNVNFLAANTQTPGNGSLGSGIYSKNLGALVYTYEPDGESKLLVANVKIGNSHFGAEPSISIIKLDKVETKIETGDAFPQNGYHLHAGPGKDHYLDYRYYKHQTENYTLVKLEKSISDEVEACNNGFCCKLSYSAKDMKEDYYFGAFSGLNNVFGYYHWYEETCILLRCDSYENKPCVMQPSRANTVFQKLKIKAMFSSEKIYPTVSKNKHRLAPKNEWKYEINGEHATLSFKTKSTEPLLKAALMGRFYDRDPPFIPWRKEQS